MRRVGFLEACYFVFEGFYKNLSLLFWNLLFLIIIPQLETDSWLEWGERKKLCWWCNMLLKLVTFCFHAFRPSSGSICLTPLVKCHHTPSSLVTYWCSGLGEIIVSPSQDWPQARWSVTSDSSGSTTWPTVCFLIVNSTTSIFLLLEKIVVSCVQIYHCNCVLST